MTATESFLDGKVILHAGDCLDVLKTLEPNSIDAVVSDPPYGLEFMGKGWDGADGFRRSLNKADADRDNVFGRASKRGPEYKAGTVFQQFMHAVGVEAFRVLKPGGHFAAFGGTRTYHRMTCAIEDAGFEIRDMISWLYGSGFPKSLDVSKAIDKMHGAEREKANGRVYVPGETAPATDAAKLWDGFGTALKPACEPIVLARKPLIGTVAENVLKHGTGALNIDGCRVATDESITATRNIALGSSAGGVYGTADKPGIYEQHNNGRWPANIVHDGSDEVIAAFPGDLSSGKPAGIKAGGQGNAFGHYNGGIPVTGFGDTGSAARFFYTAKADADDRLGSKHPTVKPLDLMQWLVRLITPPGGAVLDPFAGTGTTGEAAWREGFRAILIEHETEYHNDIRRRMAHALAGPLERKNTIAKLKPASKSTGDDLFSRSTQAGSA